MSSATTLLLGLETALVARDPRFAAAQPQCTSSRSQHLSPDRQMRHARWWTWQTAAVRSNYAEALLKACRAERVYLRWVLGDEAENHKPSGRDEGAMLDIWRQAKALQILTPAPSKADVVWKRRAAKDEHLPIAKEAIDAAIAEDEAWLAAHALPRKGGRKAKPELQLVA